MSKLINYNKKTFSMLSYDDKKKIYLSSSTTLAIAFDDYTDEVCVNGQSKKSVDAIYIEEGIMHCIEFKNINLDKRFKNYKNSVELKFFHTLLTIKQNESVFENYDYTFYLVVPDYRDSIHRNRLFEKEISYISVLDNVRKVKILTVDELDIRFSA